MAGSWTEGDARWQEREERVERGYHGLCKACAKIENVPVQCRRLSPYSDLQRDGPRRQGAGQVAAAEEACIRHANRQGGPRDNRRLNPLRVFWDQEAYDDTLALIYWCCGDRIDRHIIDKRIEGLAITAVARDLGVRWPEVKRQLLRIEVEFWRIRKSG